MEWFSRLRLTAIPDWSKYLFLVVIVVIGITNTFVFFDGILHGKDGLVADSLHILGVILPIMSITYVAVYIRYGDASIIEQTRKLFLETLPRAVSQIQESDLVFRDVDDLSSPRQTQNRPISVESNYQDGHIESDFKIGLWEGLQHYYFLIRLEINYRRINFNLYLDKNQVETICKKSAENINELNTAENTKIIVEKLGHALKGANYGDAGAGKKDDGGGDYQSGYIFNEKLITRQLLGKNYLCLVAMKGVSSGFIWDAGELFYFSFDLMLMLRAMIDECPEIMTADQCEYLPKAAASRARNKRRSPSTSDYVEISGMMIASCGLATAAILGVLTSYRLTLPAQLSSIYMIYTSYALIVSGLLLGLTSKLLHLGGSR